MHFSADDMEKIAKQGEGNGKNAFLTAAFFCDNMSVTERMRKSGRLWNMEGTFMVRVGMSRRDLEEALCPKLPMYEERVEVCALYAKSDAVELVWAVLDFMDFNLKVVNTVKAAIQAKTGVEAAHIHILTTHNHGGGTPNLKKLSEIAAECAADAQKKAEAVMMRCAFCKTDRQISIMRRIRVPELDGVTTLFYGTSEKTAFDAAPHIEYKLRRLREGVVEYCNSEPTKRPFTPFAAGDPEIAAVQFARADGSILGTVARFAAHATCSNSSDSYSSDYPWRIRRYLEEHAGGTAMFLNGPCGNIAPGNVSKRDGTSEAIGEYIAKKALEALENAPFEPLNILKDEIVEVRLPVREEVLNKGVELSTEMPEALPERLRYLERKRLGDTLPFLDSKYREGETEVNESVPIHLGFLRLNDLFWAAFPGESFRETGNALQNAFPNRRICTVTEHERTVMYLPPLSECAQGGYETTCMLTKPGAEQILRDAAIKGLEAFAED